MSTKIAINGFGRIGRLALRQALKRSDLEVVAINSRGTVESHAYLLKYDSAYGTLDEEVTKEGEYLKVGNRKIKVFCQDKPEDIDWSSVGVEIVIESTGLFTKKTDAGKHLQGTVKKVLVSAPGKELDGTFVLGVNEESYDPSKHHIISNASCTTNCLAPIAKVLHENFGIEKGQMTTIHAFTNDQNIMDNSHKKDFRRARTATSSIIPTTTGAAEAVGEVLPELKGKLTGIAVRTPSPSVSLVDLVIETKKNTTKEEINQAFKKASEENLKNILKINFEPLVSIDYKGDFASSIVDGLSTSVISGNLVKVLAWYDNEWGYTARLLDLTAFVSKSL